MELKALSLLGVLKPEQRDETLEQIAYVLQCMHENKITLTDELKARVCEYSIMRGNLKMANTFISSLTTSSSTISDINENYLKEFYKMSLKEDNLDGIAYLVNYAKEFEISLKDFNLNSFRPALDYYMNKDFNLSKVMTFLKFYDRYYQDKTLHEMEALGIQADD